MDLAKLCREETTLTAMQIELLKRIAVCFPFVADLTQATARLYVREKGGDFLVAAYEKPHTFYRPDDNLTLGMKVGAREIPVASSIFARKLSERFGNGDKIPSAWGAAIWDNNLEVGTPIAVVTLDGKTAWDIAGGRNLVDTAKLILKNARKNLDREMYRHFSASDGVIVADRYNRITYADAAALRIYRVLGVGSLIGGHIFDEQLTRHITKETLQPDRPWEREIEIGGFILNERRVVINEGGVLKQTILIISDLTEIRQKDKEIKIKSAVIKEIHHRVKNNLQTIASLVRLQSRRSKSPEVKAALKETVNRVQTIAVVHEFLSQQGEENINIGEIMQSIFDLVVNTMTLGAHITTKLESADMILSSRYANSLALVLNELVLNSLEHGFAGRESGEIIFSADEDEENYNFTLKDNGVGLPRDFSLEKSKSLGLQIVRTLIEGDLGGEIILSNDNGTSAKISVPKNLS